VEYVLYRYAGAPDRPLDVRATADPATVRALTRAWRERRARVGDEGFIVAVDERAVVHCPPRAGGRTPKARG
jgi:hypothetical protein